MRGLKKRVLALILVQMILGVSFSGCVFLELPPPKGAIKHPARPTLTTDGGGNTHVTWKSYAPTEKQSVIAYCKLNPEGTVLSLKEILHKSWLTKVIVDSQDGIHIFSEGNGIFYLKLGTTGEILANPIFLGNYTFTDLSSETKLFDVVIDRNDCMHILWLINKDGDARYIKMETNENILENRCLERFFGDIPLQYGILIFYLSIEINSDGIIYATWSDKLSTLNTNTGKTSNITELKNASAIYDFPVVTDNKTNRLIYIGDNGVIDSEENIHIVGVDYYGYALTYSKFDRNGAIVGSPLEIANGSEMIASPKVAIDSEDNIHIVWHSVREEIWSSGRFVETYYYYTVYYAKLDKEGNILIKDMIIDTDGKPSWKIGEYTSSIVNTILLVVGIACIVLVSVIIVAFFLKRRKRKEANKTPLLKEKHPPPPW